MHVSQPVFELANDALADKLQNRKIVVVVDSTVDALYGEMLRAYASQRLECVGIKTFAASEHMKTLESLQDVVTFAAEAGLPRKGIFVAVGGGVTLDIVGAAAAMYRRGTEFFRIPTTVVGAVDVSVGIKQGVNFGGKKNFLGAFHVPLGGINDPRFFASLPRRELSAGLAEIIKVGLLLDPSLFELLERHGEDLFTTAFQAPQSVALETMMRAELAMMRELQPNLWEHDLRRLVDFGHTFSSWLEPASAYALPHGHAVALDMLVSTALAVEARLCSYELLRRLVAMYRAVELPLEHPLVRTSSLLEALAPMRLHREGALNLVVPVELGLGTYLQDVEPEQLDRALRLVARVGVR
jgi:3-dehydroquinate synthase